MADRKLPELKRDGRPRYVEEDRGYTTPCWTWLVVRPKDGYGAIWWDGRTQKAHRVSYELVNGPISPGLTLDHLCRNRACANPDHLEPVTNAVNCQRGKNIRLNMAIAREMRELASAGWPKKWIARAYGIRPGHLFHILKNRTWAET